MKLLGLLKRVDVFGRKVELRLNKSKTHKTYCGTFMTLILFFITLATAMIYAN